MKKLGLRKNSFALEVVRPMETEESLEVHKLWDLWNHGFWTVKSSEKQGLRSFEEATLGLYR